jgi:hypothetical protein
MNTKMATSFSISVQNTSRQAAKSPGLFARTTLESSANLTMGLLPV